MIYDLLSIGCENAKTANQLASFLHTNRRTISAAIERERRDGKAICATSTGNNPGYFIPADKKEMREYLKSLEHRQAEIEKTRRACADCLDDLPDTAGGACLT